MGFLEYIKTWCKQLTDMITYSRYIRRKNDHDVLIENDNFIENDNNNGKNNLKVQNMYKEGSFCVFLYDEIDLIAQ